jgi:solute carrier family 35, member E3
VPALAIIVTSGVLAFCLNFSIFYVIHSTAAVTFNAAGNLKVAVAVLASWAVFRNPVSGMNAVGCAVTLAGCTFYGCVRHLVSKKQKAAGSILQWWGFNVTVIIMNKWIFQVTILLFHP